MPLIAITIIIVILLILTNAITDAPNAICTLVASKVMPFKKASLLSALFNMLRNYYNEPMQYFCCKHYQQHDKLK